MAGFPIHSRYTTYQKDGFTRLNLTIYLEKKILYTRQLCRDCIMMYATSYDVCTSAYCYLLAFPQDFFNVLSYLLVGFIFHVNQNLFSAVW